MNLYQTDAPIPLFFQRIRNNALVTGLSVTVVVKNALTGATLLSSTALTEVTPGYYAFNWNHSLTAETDCVATYTVGGTNYLDPFRVVSNNEIQQAQGKAV